MEPVHPAGSRGPAERSETPHADADAVAERRAAVAAAVAAPDRLAAVRATGLLDTGPEPAFDRIAQLAARLLGAPVALLTLVDEDRDFVKAQVGLPEPLAEAREIRAAPSFCHDALARHEAGRAAARDGRPDALAPFGGAVAFPVAVGDAAADPYYCTFPSVQAFGVRACLTAPLVGPAGHGLGSLCVLDFAPRDWSAEQLATLADLARNAAAEVAVRAGARAAELHAERLALALRAGDLGWWEWDVPAGRVTWSPEVEAMHGLAPGAFAGTFEHYQGTIYPADRARVLDELARTIAERRPRYRVRYRYRRAEEGGGASTRWLDGEARLVLDPLGAPLRLVGVVGDATERVEAEDAAALLLDVARLLGDELAAARDVEAALGAVAELAVPRLADWCGVDLLDADGATIRRVAIHHADPAVAARTAELARRFPARLDSLAGIGAVIRTGRPEWVADLKDEQLPALARGGEHLAELRALAPRSHVIVPLEARGRQLGAITLVQRESGRRFDERGLATAADLARRVALALDASRLHGRARAMADALTAANEQLQEQQVELELTNERLQEQQAELETQAEELERRAAVAEGARAEAERQRARAEEANAAKGQFLATMSHELRTPLNAIQGYADLIAMGVRGPTTAEQQEDLARVRRSSQHLLSLINDLLNFAKLEAGHVEFRLEAVDVAAAVADAESLVAPQARAKGVTLGAPNGAPNGALPVRARADGEKLQQVLLNLLTNAVKFTDAGGRVAAWAEDDAAAGAVRVRVRDTGRGIAPGELGRAFEPFVQIDRHLTHASQQGVGLGLAISRDLARGMGGELTAESVLGAGSTFTLTLPRVA